jgi:hypothetical protein
MKRWIASKSPFELMQFWIESYVLDLPRVSWYLPQTVLDKARPTIIAKVTEPFANIEFSLQS